MTEIFPTINSTISPNAVCKLVQQQYGLSEISEYSIIRLAMNHLYRVQDGETSYVFRVYTHNWRTELEIEEEIRLLTHLKEDGRPVAYPIADLFNKYIQEIQAPEGKRFGVLFSFAKGKKAAKFSPETSFLIGQALAKVHQSTENFELKRISYDTQNLLTNPVLRTKEFYSTNVDEIEFLEKLSSYLLPKLENIDPLKTRFGSVHLDAWFDNLHIDDKEGITFFDFDFCGNGYLCFDISYFLFQLLATHLNEEEYQIKVESFMKGYESVTELSNEEKEYIPFVSLAIITYYIAVQCDRFEYWTNIFLNEDHLKRMVGNLKRWMAYHKIEIE
ncbi:phosphotransferase enzyme family protein [Chryseobacterium taiwanense]|uniref:Aminoglycoside phosphotransferase n=1 Tax=Chryseobacterium taiwanense TaxID=363331 RepID=A0A0B4E851_9FLAO|nr:phosphotransferase [Chryseobacterium taiwanense]KIC62803.1 aminoglycoside phosphotransferase [Chryseobacterium taiwanense]